MQIMKKKEEEEEEEEEICSACGRTTINRNRV